MTSIATFARSPEAIFAALIAKAANIGRLYEPDLVFIGGLAAYLHATNHSLTAAYAEATADAAFYISLSALSDLREIEELSQNSRLTKHAFQKAGFSFDVYAERQSSLPVPYDQVAAFAVEYDGVRVASLEHLLVLKLGAAVDRHASEHGRKDAKDALRILLLASTSEFDTERAVAFMQDEHIERLGIIVKGPEFLALTGGNAKVAKELRVRCQDVFARLKDAHDAPTQSDAQPKPPKG